jgi:hypothetical protein
MKLKRSLLTMTRKEPKHIDSALTREEADWMRGVDDITSRRMVEYLKAGTDVRRSIDTLNRMQLVALAEIARATYIGEVVARRERLKDQPAETLEQLDMWLL